MQDVFSLSLSCAPLAGAQEDAEAEADQTAAAKTQEFEEADLPFDFRFRCGPNNNDDTFVGLSQKSSAESESWSSVQFSAECQGSSLRVWHQGSHYTDISGLDQSDDIKIAVDDSKQVTLWFNGEKKYTWS